MYVYSRKLVIQISVIRTLQLTKHPSEHNLPHILLIMWLETNQLSWADVY